MSRVGKKPIPVPQGVKVQLSGSTLNVEGPKGKLHYGIPESMAVEVKPDQVIVSPKRDDALLKPLHGLSRALIANMVKGVSTGFSKTLEIVGVGFKAELKGSDLAISVGFSHVVNFPAPQGIKFRLESPTRMVVEGSDRELVGKIAAEIREIRAPEPYKGKGIKYADEFIRRKAGKAAV